MPERELRIAVCVPFVKHTVPLPIATDQKMHTRRLRGERDANDTTGAAGKKGEP